MKRRRNAIFAMLLTIVVTTNAQVSVIPQGFNYQAVARDTIGSPKANQNITIRFTITNQTETSTPYIETHTKTTDNFGLFTAVIGQGVQTGGNVTFDKVDWTLHNYYTKIEIQEGLNWYLIGKEPLLTVPYAMVSQETLHPVPAGTVMAYFGTTAPDGWLLCDGSAISRTTYIDLFTAIGTVCGSGNGATTFNLPDLRGRFLRGVDGTAGNDPDAATRIVSNIGGNSGNNVGSLQTDQFQSHSHSFTVNSDNTADGMYPEGVPYNSPVGTANTNATGGAETRPKNVYVNYIIRF